jgi:hypothetical protein
VNVKRGMAGIVLSEFQLISIRFLLVVLQVSRSKGITQICTKLGIICLSVGEVVSS